MSTQQLQNAPVNPEHILYIEEDLEKARSRLDRCQNSIKEYTHVTTTLATYPDQPRRRVMASVCGGLAYFDAVAENTNSFLTLLGDGWFAERSSKQCVGIAERRMKFLKEEEKVFTGQVKQLEATLKMAQEEGAAGNFMMNHHQDPNEMMMMQQHQQQEQDEFEECDQLNLRELEMLEEEMLRETGGGEWTEEVLMKKVKERQEAKRKRRLEAESVAQKTVGEALLEAHTKNNNNNQQEEVESSEKMKKKTSTNVPQNPGQIGIIEQLEMLNEHLGQQQQQNNSNDNNNANNNSNNRRRLEVEQNDDEAEEEQLPKLVSSTSEAKRPEVVVEKKQESEQEKEKKVNVADGTGGVMERNSTIVQKQQKTTTMSSSSSITEKSQGEAPPTPAPKKVSLFKQRKAGLAP